MSHRTLVGGTAYEVKGGECLVGGTAYSIKKGRTLVGGTGYDVDFTKTFILRQGSVSSQGGSVAQYITITLNGETWSPTAGTEVEVEEGSVLSISVKRYNSRSNIRVYTSEDTYTTVASGNATYEYKITSNTTVVRSVNSSQGAVVAIYEFLKS